MNRLQAWAMGGLALLVVQAAQADIKVGVTLPLTGGGAAFGIPAKNALDFWPKEIAGEKVVLTVLDDAGDPTAAIKNARRFVGEGVDVILGSANTPSSLAIVPIAVETKTVQMSPSPVELADDGWTFRAAMNADFYTEGQVAYMKKDGIKTVAYMGVSDAYGESVLQSLNKYAGQHGIKVVASERFTRADTSVAAQALKVAAARPDAVLVAAIGGGAALPQKALAERGYKGKVYHTAASVSPDFLRLAGKEAEGAVAVSGPEQVPEQLPASHPAKQVALNFVQQYEAKYGPGSRTQFGAHIYDFGLALQQAVPLAMKKAKPGTAEFRVALKDALESGSPVIVTKGPLKYTPTNHWGHGPDARVMLKVENGQWKLVN